MKNYTEPKLEIVTIEATDVITTSLKSLFRGIGGLGIENGGHSNLSDYEMPTIG